MRVAFDDSAHIMVTSWSGYVVNDLYHIQSV